MAKQIFNKSKIIKGKQILITADDYGHNTDIDSGILKCLDYNSVKNIAVFPSHVKHLNKYEISKLKNASIGLHLDIIPLNKDVNNIQDWMELKSFIFPDINKIKSELSRLNESYYHLQRLGINPIFINGHQHVHVFPIWAIAIARWCKNKGIKFTRLPYEGWGLGSCQTKLMRPALLVLEILGQISKRLTQKYNIEWIPTICQYGRSFNLEEVLKTIDTIPFETVELMTHPGCPSNDYITSSKTPLEHYHQMNELLRKDLHNLFKSHNIKITSYNNF